MCYNLSYWVTLLSNPLHTYVCKESETALFMCICTYMRIYEYIYIYIYINTHTHTLVQTGLQQMYFNLRFDNLYVCFSTPYRNFPWFCKCVLPQHPSCAYCTGHCTVSLHEALVSRLYSGLLVTGQYKLIYPLTEDFPFCSIPCIVLCRPLSSTAADTQVL